MKVPDSVRRVANRHVAKLLTRIEQVHDLSGIVKGEIKREMHFLAEDVVKSMEDERDEVRFDG